uniref:Uncharacterized protein n=1 Tax=viral metagenome TaxID=1070528 RepID=A0A6M3IER9_9ZZZZ
METKGISKRKVKKINLTTPYEVFYKEIKKITNEYETIVYEHLTQKVKKLCITALRKYDFFNPELWRLQIKHYSTLNTKVVLELEIQKRLNKKDDMSKCNEIIDTTLDLLNDESISLGTKLGAELYHEYEEQPTIEVQGYNIKDLFSLFKK